MCKSDIKMSKYNSSCTFISRADVEDTNVSLAFEKLFTKIN